MEILCKCLIYRIFQFDLVTFLIKDAAEMLKSRYNKFLLLTNEFC